tara:strand:- start:55 stop:192 length:138 start_codon:yes stop_codon:yes gene_type:complete
MKHNTNDSNIFDLIKERNATIKEMFEINSIAGIKMAGITSKLDNI